MTIYDILSHSMKFNERDVPEDYMAATYPEYMDRLANGKAVQIHEGIQLPSAADKIEMLGGLEIVRKNLLYAEGKKGLIVPYILQSCQLGAMVPLEIMKFYDTVAAPRELDPSTLHYAITYANAHNIEEVLRTISGITYIYQVRGKYSVLQRNGYETTSEGRRLFASILPSQVPNGEKQYYPPLTNNYVSAEKELYWDKQ